MQAEVSPPATLISAVREPRVSASVRHLDVLDGLRGLAILLVVLPHVEDVALFPGPEILAKMVHRLAHGVEIFFVLSGFCLALPLLQRLRDEGRASLDLGVFYVNRVWRIFPLYVAATLIAAGVALVLAAHGTQRLISAPPPLDVARALLLLDRNVDYANATLWSVPVQLRWYLIFPLVLWAWARAPRVVIALACGAWVAYAGTRLHSIDLGTLPIFLLGIIAADLFVRRDRLARWALVALPLAILLGAVGDHVATFPDPHGIEVKWTMQPTTPGWQLAAFFLVLTATMNPRVGRLFTFAPLRALGVASFSIYLTHEAAIVAIAGTSLPFRGELAIVVSLALGLAVWAVVERPLTDAALRRRVRARVLPSAQAALRHLGLPSGVELGATPGTAAALPRLAPVSDIAG